MISKRHTFFSFSGICDTERRVTQQCSCDSATQQVAPTQRRLPSANSTVSARRRATPKLPHFNAKLNQLTPPSANRTFTSTARGLRGTQSHCVLTQAPHSSLSAANFSNTFCSALSPRLSHASLADPLAPPQHTMFSWRCAGGDRSRLRAVFW
jgi:hypothetical protein